MNGHTALLQHYIMHQITPIIACSIYLIPIFFWKGGYLDPLSSRCRSSVLIGSDKRGGNVYGLQVCEISGFPWMSIC